MGILLPSSVDKERPGRGTVVVIGPDVIGVTVGDEVFFKKYAPDEIKYEDEPYLLLDITDILAKIV